MDTGEIGTGAENETSAAGGPLYAWLTRGEDGTEGIMVAPLPSGLLFSLVFDDQAAARKHVPFIRKEMALRAGTAQLVEFTRGETVAEVIADMLAVSGCAGRPDPERVRGLLVAGPPGVGRGADDQTSCRPQTRPFRAG